LLTRVLEKIGMMLGQTPSSFERERPANV
jgi:hypothetical protein